MSLTLLAAGTEGGAPGVAQLPSFIDGGFIFGLLFSAFLFMVVIGILRLTVGAHNQKTGALASKGLNYLLLAGFLVLILGGGLWVIASGAIDGLTTGVSTDVGTG